jgi:hypothetical protein
MEQFQFGNKICQVHINLYLKIDMRANIFGMVSLSIFHAGNRC